MHFVLHSLQIILIVGIGCHASLFHFVLTPPPQTPPGTNSIPQTEWRTFNSDVYRIAPGITLSPVEAGFLAHIALDDFTTTRGLSNKKAPAAMVVIQEGDQVLLATSLKSEKGHVLQGVYYKKIDLDVTDSIDQTLDSLQAEPGWERGHCKSAACAEFHAFRVFDRLHRTQRSTSFHWPSQQAVIHAGGRNGYIAPCAAKERLGSINSSGQHYKTFGCIDLMRRRNYPVFTPEQYESFREEVTRLINTPGAKDELLRKLGLARTYTFNKRSIDKRPRITRRQHAMMLKRLIPSVSDGRSQS